MFFFPLLDVLPEHVLAIQYYLNPMARVYLSWTCKHFHKLEAATDHLPRHYKHLYPMSRIVDMAHSLVVQRRAFIQEAIRAEESYNSNDNDRMPLPCYCNLRLVAGGETVLEFLWRFRLLKPNFTMYKSFSVWLHVEPPSCYAMGEGAVIRHCAGTYKKTWLFTEDNGWTKELFSSWTAAKRRVMAEAVYLRRLFYDPLLPQDLMEGDDENLK